MLTVWSSSASSVRSTPSRIRGFGLASDRRLQAVDDLGGGQLGAVVEGDVLPDSELPGQVVGLGPLGGQPGLGVAEVVEHDQRLGGLPARQLERVVAQRRQAGARRQQHRDPDAGAVTGAIRSVGLAT